jgi:VCBS repeat protein
MEAPLLQHTFSAFAALMLLTGCATAPPEETAESRTPSFAYSVVDPEGEGRIVIGDVDQDGRNDLVVHTWSTNRGVDSDGSVTWYRYPDWERFIIKDGDHIFGDGVEVVDLDGDSDLDVVTAKGNDSSAQVWWFENPGGAATGGWTEFEIAEVEVGSEVKDLYVADIDHDGKVDVAVRTKHFFTLYFQEEPRKWTERKIENQEREGMKMADLDGDGDYDAIMNGYWLECPAKPREEEWAKHVIDEQWFTDVTGGWQDFSVRIATADYDGDGKLDVAFSHSEKTGYNVTWYSSGDPKGGQAAWQKHEIDVVDYCHTLRAADMDNDGDVDLVAAVLKRSETPEIVIFLNENNGANWTRFKVADNSAYKARVGDIDDDGDQDIVTSVSWEDPPIMLWRNER